jgi:putative alpha-1,2-mannosidase
MSLYGSPADYDESLSSFLSNHVKYHEQFGSPVPNPYYWAGNEHDFLAPWLFSIGPNCTNTQYWTRKLTYMHFSNTPHGIPGNDDYGSMSTWLLFGSLGLFPQAGTSRFFIGSPRINNAKLTLKHWNKVNTHLEINVLNNSEENTFIKKLLVNNQEWKLPYIDRSMLVNENVKLDFYMHSIPSSGLCSASASASTFSSVK